MAISSIFSSSIMDVTHNTIMENITAATSYWRNISELSGTTISSAPIARDSTELRPSGPREERARYIAEISAAIGGRSGGEGNEKKPSGKKSKAVTPNESYNQWAVSRVDLPTGLYQQLAVKGMGPGRSTLSSFKGNITSSL